MLLKFQSANMHCPMLCIWESSKKVWALASLSSQAVQNTPIGRGYALMFWVFPPKCRCWKLLTCWCKTTRPYLCKRVLPKFLEYILNLVKLVTWQPWRTAEARSHVLVRWITFQVCWNRSFQQAQQDKRCIVFGVVVELGTPRISNPTASNCCMPQWPYLPDSFGHLRVGCVWRLGPTLHPPKGCANAALNCRDPTIVAWSFADYQFAHWQWVLQLNHDRFVMYGCCIDERETSVSYVFAGWQPKEAEKKWCWIGASKSDVLESRDCVLLTFV